MATELKPVDWNSGLSVGVQSIDDEHKLLIGVLNEIIDSLGSGSEYTVADRALRDLFAYVDYHFGHEEELMAAYEYPELETHKKQHRGFVEHLRELDKRLATGRAPVSELADFVQTWLVNHILVIDRKLGGYLETRISREVTPFEFDEKGPTGTMI